MTALLTVEELSAGYGDFRALFDVSFHVDERETVAVIGANGAGKSTLLRAIAGLVEVFGGAVSYRGTDLAGRSASRRVREGIVMVPEGRRLFPSLSVRENLQVGAFGGRSGPWDLDAVLAMFPLVEPLLGRPASTLSGGEQQAVAIGRGLMANPELLMLDEVSLGLAPTVVRDLYRAIPDIAAAGTTLLLVEQDIDQALAAAARVHCFLEGRISLTGSSDSVGRDDITAAYFGLQEDAR